MGPECHTEITVAFSGGVLPLSDTRKVDISQHIHAICCNYLNVLWCLAY